MELLHDVISVELLGGYRVKVTFDTQEAGTVDFTCKQPFQGPFKQWSNADFFKQVHIHPETKTLAWGEEHQVDIDPIWLYCHALNKPYPPSF